MKKFIAISESSKKILNIAQMSSNLPVNIIIVGESGVGKQMLSYEISSDADIFNAIVLEELIVNDKINLSEYQELIVLDIHTILNKKEFMEKLSGLKIIATTLKIPSEIETQFAIKIDIPPLKERPEDLESLIEVYSKEAHSIYDVKERIYIDSDELDLSSNGKSLKKSIYKFVFMNSLNDDDMLKSFELFLEKKLEKESQYKELLKYFEIPLLKSAQKKFKSQLQMATNLNINRITLRKKLELYFGTK